MDKHLHIICLTIPFPADYGGVFDLFYKLPAFKKAGIKIHLHCFQYGRVQQPELEKYCEEVFYYDRITGSKGFSTRHPYIVSSRKNETLFMRLLQDDYPILMEGVHTTALTLDDRFKNRKKFVRIHNVEQHYYRHLFKCADQPLNKFYYLLESKLLKSYEKLLAENAAGFFTVTEKDADFYRDKLAAENVQHVPVFLPPGEVVAKPGMGCYCLYHGNLEVEENEEAALWLLRNVFQKSDIPFIIAGKNPSGKLRGAAASKNNIKVLSNPSPEQMQNLIQDAQINVLPSVTDTGIKIKLIHALFSGRHCLVNQNMVSGSGMEELCHIVEGESAFRERIQQLYDQRFTPEEADFRKEFLMRIFDNDANAATMLRMIFGDNEVSPVDANEIK